MKKKQIVYCILILVLSIMVIKSATAEMVVFENIILDRSNIIASVFPGAEQKTPQPKFPDDYKIYVDIGFIAGGVPGTGWGPMRWKYQCRDKWDSQKVNKVKNNIADYINKNNNIEVLKMLSNVGLSGCNCVGVGWR